MEKNRLLFIFKYLMIAALLVCGAVTGRSFTPAALCALYVCLATQFLTADRKENSEIGFNLFTGSVYVVIMTFSIVMFFSIVRIVLKQIADLDVYSVKSSALYFILVALFLREIGRFSFIEKDWKYFFPGILSAASVSIAVFMPAWAAADLLAAALVTILAFILAFRKAYVIMREIIDRI